MYNSHTHTHSLIRNICVPFLFPATFTSVDVTHVARALKRLHESSHSSLTDLSIGVLPCPELLEVLLAASPSLTSMHVEIQDAWDFQGLFPSHGWTAGPGAVKLLSERAASVRSG